MCGISKRSKAVFRLVNCFRLRPWRPPSQAYLMHDAVTTSARQGLFHGTCAMEKERAPVLPRINYGPGGSWCSSGDSIALTDRRLRQICPQRLLTCPLFAPDIPRCGPVMEWRLEPLESQGHRPHSGQSWSLTGLQMRSLKRERGRCARYRLTILQRPTHGSASSVVYPRGSPRCASRTVPWCLLADGDRRLHRGVLLPATDCD